MVITEMDKGEEKLLAVAWTYLYSVGIQIVDSAKPVSYTHLTLPTNSRV